MRAPQPQHYLKGTFFLHIGLYWRHSYFCLNPTEVKPIESTVAYNNNNSMSTSRVRQPYRRARGS